MRRRTKLNGASQVGRWYRKGDLLLLEIRYREGQRAVPQVCYFKPSQVTNLRMELGVSETIARNLWPWAFRR
jgi:hypothetical protein